MEMRIIMNPSIEKGSPRLQGWEPHLESKTFDEALANPGAVQSGVIGVMSEGGPGARITDDKLSLSTFQY